MSRGPLAGIFVDTLKPGLAVWTIGFCSTAGFDTTDAGAGACFTSGDFSTSVTGDDEPEVNFGPSSAKPLRDILSLISSKLGRPFANILFVGEQLPELPALGLTHNVSSTLTASASFEGDPTEEVEIILRSLFC